MFEQHTIQDALHTGATWSPAGIAGAAFIFIFLYQRFIHGKAKLTDDKVSKDAAKIYTKIGIIETKLDEFEKRQDRQQLRLDKVINGKQNG